MISYDFVPFHAVAAEIAPNVLRQYHEMTDGDDYGPPDIDWPAYLSASHAGICAAVIMRDDGELVGYSVYTVGTNLRYRTHIEADSNGLFIERPYRGRYTAEFLSKCDEYLKSAGVHETHYTLSDDRVGKLLERKGYRKPKYKIWSKKYGK